MKMILVLLAVLFFAAPAFAQDYSIYGAYGLFQPYQLYMLDQQSQPDQSIRFYLPPEIQQTQPQNYQSKTVQRSTTRTTKTLPNVPANGK
jgi:hypothetical protein